MSKGIWIIKSTQLVYGRPSRSTFEKMTTKSEAEFQANKALKNSHFDVEIYFHEYEDDDTGPAYGSFSERLEYDYSLN